MQIEICELCSKELTPVQESMLEFLVFHLEAPTNLYFYKDAEFLDPELERLGFVVTHETDEGYMCKAKFRNCIIETHKYDNGRFVTDEESCHYICKDFDYHSFLLSK